MAKMSLFVFSVAAVLGLVQLSGCQAGGQTTELRHDDLNVATAEMAASLAASDFLAGRGPDSPPIVVTINKVENLTSDIIPPGEQWMLMARLQGSQPIRQLSRDKNIRFQIPPERRKLLAGADVRLTPEQAQEYEPTHVMKAIYRSSTRTVRGERKGHIDRRQDYYTLAYQISDIRGRKIEWEDSFEFKREAAGLIID